MSSDAQQIGRVIERLKQEVEREVNDKLPRKVGIKAVQLFKQNFRDSGFHDGGLRPWQKSQRELARGKGASSRYKTLTSARNHLMNSTEARIGRGEVVIENSVPYAKLHNEGGMLVSNPTITPKMRRFAWAMVYQLSGRRKRGGKAQGKGKTRAKTKQASKPLPAEAQKWLGLALTKKTKLHIRAKMPKRQFIGESRDLTQLVTKEINDSINRIQNGISSL